MRNLTICPTLNRPDQLSAMVKSFYTTQAASDLIILTAHGSITQLINSVETTGYTHVTITNDDFIFKTKGWDLRLMDSPGFAYGFDGVNKHLPTTCTISTRVTDALGWVQLPTLDHLCGDMVWSHIGQKLKIIKFCPDVIIEHNHYLFGKAEKDATYEKTNSVEQYRKDNKAFEIWVKGDAYYEIERVRRALGL